MNETVAFTRMDQGTFEEYQLLDRLYRDHARKLADEVLAMLLRLGGDPLGYRVTRLEHSLQTATRAQREGADDELVAVALLHDIGDTLAPYNHADLAVAILKPFVSEENRWVVEKHAVFQGLHYWHHYGLDRHGREAYRGHPWFAQTARFCDEWDQVSFDPINHTMPLSAFEPMVRRLFAEPRHEFTSTSLT